MSGQRSIICIDCGNHYCTCPQNQTPAEPRYEGPSTVRALNRVADRIEAALRELLPHTFADLKRRGDVLVAALREEAKNELEELWPK